MDNSAQKYGIFHFLIEKDTDLFLLCAERLDLNKNYVSQLAELGSIYLNERRCFFTDGQIYLKPNDYLRVHTTPRRFRAQSYQWLDLIVDQNEHFLVVDKPNGIPTHATVDNWTENACYSLAQKLAIPLHVTHRLDAATSGLLVFAKTKEYQRAFNLILQAGEIKKLYWAAVSGPYKGPSSLIHYMEPSLRAPKKLVDTPQESHQKCELQILQNKFLVDLNISLLQIELVTGRTHQIRAQLSHMGHAVLGDTMYGPPPGGGGILGEENIRLQSSYLSFKTALDLKPNTYELPFRHYE